MHIFVVYVFIISISLFSYIFYFILDRHVFTHKINIMKLIFEIISIKFSRNIYVIKRDECFRFYFFFKGLLIKFAKKTCKQQTTLI